MIFDSSTKVGMDGFHCIRFAAYPADCFHASTSCLISYKLARQVPTRSFASRSYDSCYSNPFVTALYNSYLNVERTLDPTHGWMAMSNTFRAS